MDKRFQHFPSPSVSPLTAIVGHSFVRFLPQAFEDSHPLSPVIGCVRGGYVDDMFNEVDLLPSSVFSIVVCAGSNELCSKSCNVPLLIGKLETLVRYILDGRSGRAIPSVGIVLPSYRIVPRYVNPNRAYFLSQFNNRVQYFRSLFFQSPILSPLSIESGMLGSSTRSLYCRDGYHPSGEGTELLAKRVKAFFGLSLLSSAVEYQVKVPRQHRVNQTRMISHSHQALTGTTSDNEGFTSTGPHSGTTTLAAVSNLSADRDSPRTIFSSPIEPPLEFRDTQTNTPCPATSRPTREASYVPTVPTANRFEILLDESDIPDSALEAATFKQNLPPDMEPQQQRSPKRRAPKSCSSNRAQPPFSTPQPPPALLVNSTPDSSFQRQEAPPSVRNSLPADSAGVAQDILHLSDAACARRSPEQTSDVNHSLKPPTSSPRDGFNSSSLLSFSTSFATPISSPTTRSSSNDSNTRSFEAIPTEGNQRYALRSQGSLV
jgi:hypothetical protein